jgi:myosin heavy subunit
MGLDYERIKKKHEHGSFWTSYADLFLMLSVVFLMLYVVATLRSGTFGVEKNAEYKRISKEAEDLREQIRVYNTLRDEQVAKGTEQEQQTYNNLMDKLKLLQDEAKNEKDALRKKAKENEQKEEALNQYQQIVRNIINVNMLAKTQLKHRDEVIQTKENVIKSQTEEISQKEKIIADNSKQINYIQNELARKIQKIKDDQKRAVISKKAMDASIAKLRAASTAQIENLKSQSERERAELNQQLAQTKADYQNQMEGLKAESAKRLAAERAAFEHDMAQQRLSAAERQAKEAAFRAQAEGQAKELANKLSGLAAQAAETEKRLQSAKEGQSRALATVENLKNQNQGLSADLKKAKELVEAKKNLANAIKKNFQKAGIAAEVDTETGDVTLTFPDDYFEAGKASLTDGMEGRLKKFVPAYTKSLFSDPKTANKISNVEIIGFASPTYKGKYVNPQSLRQEDKEAVDYNLRLSFSRANSIFKYIFDKRKLTYEHQEHLLPLVKVVGRGYLPEGKTGTDIKAGLPEKDFCLRYNCKQAQKVVLKFNLKD